MTNPRTKRWVDEHPYLAAMAKFQEALEGADPGAPLPPPPFDAYAGDYALGVPLLHSAVAAVEVAAAGPAFAGLVGRAAAADLPPKLGDATRTLRDALSARFQPGYVLRWVATGDGDAPPEPGLARFLGWKTLARALAPTVDAFAAWRDEAKWARGECPTCGAPPPMAQLVEQAAGRQRFLACTCCHTRWAYKRVGCPFCANDAQPKLDILEVEAKEPLRIDSCGECKGYLKTYLGQGDEDLYLADWTTLHLDVLAGERGLVRRGASLYEL